MTDKWLSPPIRLADDRDAWLSPKWPSETVSPFLLEWETGGDLYTVGFTVPYDQGPHAVGAWIRPSFGGPCSIQCAYPREMRLGPIQCAAATRHGMYVTTNRRVYVGVANDFGRDTANVAFGYVGWQAPALIDEISAFAGGDKLLIRCGYDMHVLDVQTGVTVPFQTGLAGTHPCAIACSPDDPHIYFGVASDSRVRLYDVRVGDANVPRWTSDVPPSHADPWMPSLGFSGDHVVSMDTTPYTRQARASSFDPRSASTSRLSALTLESSAVRPVVTVAPDNIVFAYTHGCTVVCDITLGVFTLPPPELMPEIPLPHPRVDDRYFGADGDEEDALYDPTTLDRRGGRIFGVRVVDGGRTVLQVGERAMVTALSIVPDRLPFEGPSPPDLPPPPVAVAAAATEAVLQATELGKRAREGDEGSEAGGSEDKR